VTIGGDSTNPYASSCIIWTNIISKGGRMFSKETLFKQRIGKCVFYKLDIIV